MEFLSCPWLLLSEMRFGGKLICCVREQITTQGQQNLLWGFVVGVLCAGPQRKQR